MKTKFISKQTILKFIKLLLFLSYYIKLLNYNSTMQSFGVRLEVKDYFKEIIISE